MSQNNLYDYIIAGMGCAGLSLAVRLKQSNLSFKKVLIIDNQQKNKNDRTWCFWTKEKHNWFNPIIHKSWNQLTFKSTQLNLKLNIEPYTYCLIRGLDFYDYCLKEINGDDRFEIINETIIKIEDNQSEVTITTNNNQYKSILLFNSAIIHQKLKPKDVNFIQHFKGMIVEFEEAVIDDVSPVFMDFSVEQKNDCRFIYIIPFSDKKALIEYTGFSKTTIQDEEYDAEITKYIERNFNKVKYKVLETESGKIPMHQSKFINPWGKRVINIGTAGGASKASSGYTFYFIQKSIDKIIEQLTLNPQNVEVKDKSIKYYFYDNVLLSVMNNNSINAKTIFETFFKSNKVNDILDFLNEESSLIQDFKIINSLPKKHFIVPGIKHLKN